MWMITELIYLISQIIEFIGGAIGGNYKLHIQCNTFYISAYN